jgi:uncharacterized membrane protein YfhO
MPMAMPQYSSNLGRSLCEKHFPEPIIMFLDNEKTLCKKCVPEYIEENMKTQKKALAEDPNTQINARMAGINNMALNAYQTEKSQISRSLDNITKFNKDPRLM